MGCSSLFEGCRKRGGRGIWKVERGRRLTGNGDTTETVLVLDSPDISDSVGRLEAKRIGNETVLEPKQNERKTKLINFC